MDRSPTPTPQSAFVYRHGLWDDDEARRGAEIARQIRTDDLDVVRFSFADQHGILRGKTIMAEDAIAALETGVSITSTLLLKDTSHKTVFPVFSAGGGLGSADMQGAADVVMVPDPHTFTLLPFAGRTGWILCDLAFPDGRRVPLSTRDVLKKALGRAADQGFGFITGLEVELHLFRLVDEKLGLSDGGQPGTAPAIGLLSQGYQYLTEHRFDQLEPILDILRRELRQIGLPLRSMEVEFGPSQVEFTFSQGDGLTSADRMVLFRSAVKQICRRHGILASFMCRPNFPNAMASGWHLHQSLSTAGSGDNAFMATAGSDPLSSTGMAYLGGLVRHARAASLFAAPTLNGYKRFRAHSLAPDRASWSRDNRGVMARVLGRPGDPASHIENRVGEPAANPYLYMASQLLAGLDGIANSHDPGTPTDTPYEADAPTLPRSLREAVAALDEDPFFADAIGSDFLAYYRTIKSAEISRFEEAVTDWEHREYLDLL
ncbi:MAG: glutamine synthetase family protein [Pseudomonadota bacterium]